MLDINQESIGYLLGRYVAVIELSNGHIFNSAQLGNIIICPSCNIIRYDKFKTKLQDMREEILDKVDSSGFPDRLSIKQQNQFYLGYHHQKSIFTPRLDEV